MDKIDINDKFELFSDYWQPKTIGCLNGQEVRLAKVKGEFPWHSHENEDELFLVWKGNFRVEFRDRIVSLEPGQAVVVPRGIEHRTVADEEAHILIFEPANTKNTGNIEDEYFTAPNAVHI